MKTWVRVIFSGFVLAIGVSVMAADGDIFQAASKGDLAAVRQMVSREPSLVGTRNSEGKTPLQMATCSGRVEVMKYLIANRADVNAKDNTGKTALHWAPYGGRPWCYSPDKCYTEEAKVLLDAGAEVNAVDKNGYTPLHVASWFGCKPIAEMLIAKGANVNAKNGEGRTPLDHAAYRGQSSIAELLLKHGAKVNLADAKGQRPLDYAYRSKTLRQYKLAVVAMLRKYGAK